MRKRLGRAAGLTLAFAACFVFLLSALPVSAQAAIVPPEVEAGSYAVIDASTGQVLVQKDADLARFPASVTKILTLGLALESLTGAEGELDARIEASQRACDELIPDATSIGLTPGEALTLRDLLYATQLVSANDAANVLAEHVGGSLEGFADLMNQKAAQLGLSGSHFTNPSGQPGEEHVTTAGDMAQVTRWALTVPGFRELFSATEYQMSASNKRAESALRLNNSIMLAGNRYYYEGITGGKMGYTDAARYTLSTVAARGEMELICVVLDSPTNEAKYESTRALLDYCFASFAPVVYPAASFTAEPVPVLGGSQRPLGEITLACGDVSFLLHNSFTLDDVTVNYDVPEAYVIGKDFVPTATLTLAQPGSEAVLATTSLTWDGLDEVLSANTSILVQMAQQYPVTFWLVVGLIAFTIIVLVLRSIHLRHRRNKRRAAKLAAARARLPIRIADRPQPAATRRSPGRGAASTVLLPSDGPYRPARTELRVYENTRGGKMRDAAADPRRVGRAR